MRFSHFNWAQKAKQKPHLQGLKIGLKIQYKIEQFLNLFQSAVRLELKSITTLLRLDTKATTLRLFHDSPQQCLLFHGDVRPRSCLYVCWPALSSLTFTVKGSASLNKTPRQKAPNVNTRGKGYTQGSVTKTDGTWNMVFVWKYCNHAATFLTQTCWLSAETAIMFIMNYLKYLCCHLQGITHFILNRSIIWSYFWQETRIKQNLSYFYHMLSATDYCWDKFRLFR